MKIKSTALSIALLINTQAWAQLNLTTACPEAEFNQQVRFTDIFVKYSRSGAKGRTIFGGLVPYGELWGTGAHDATTIQFSDTIELNDNIIPAWTYSLFTIPEKDEWTIILNKTTEMHGTSGYTPEKDLVRFKAKDQPTGEREGSYEVIA